MDGGQTVEMSEVAAGWERNGYTTEVFPYVAQGSVSLPKPFLTSALTRRRLTPRSSGAPTACHAGHQALGLRPILRLLSSAPCRRRPLSSNVRQHNFALAYLGVR